MQSRPESLISFASARRTESYVEAEPPEPNKGSSQKDQSRIVSLAVRFLFFVLPLAQDEGVSQCTPAGTDMNGSSWEVVSKYLESQSVGGNKERYYKVSRVWAEGIGAVVMRAQLWEGLTRQQNRGKGDCRASHSRSMSSKQSGSRLSWPTRSQRPWKE